MSEQQQDFTRTDIAWWQNRAAHYTRHGEAQLARWSADTARRLRENATTDREGPARANKESSSNHPRPQTEDSPI